MIHINNDGSVICDKQTYCTVQEGYYCWNCPLIKLLKK